jgi:hypothetical protein
VAAFFINQSLAEGVMQQSPVGAPLPQSTLTYPGVTTTLIDGTTVGMRETSATGGATIDIGYKTAAGNTKKIKVHIQP